MIILLLGSGGREHALAKALSADSEVSELHISPGNPGTAQLGTNHQLDNSAEQVVWLAKKVKADLVVIGPEAPLVAGVADVLRKAGIACFGPGKEAARLEGSKHFAKQIMMAAGVPTAGAIKAENDIEYEQALDQFGPPYVVKYDGLAAGKGVLVTTERQAAIKHARDCGEVIIEEYLDGPEVSLFVVTDGKTALPLSPAQDFKRAYDNDKGPNTGGMGAYTPLSWAPEKLSEEVLERVVYPTLQEMEKRATPFVGLLYVGLALTKQGIKVVEFNVRFGDPETQVVLPRLKSPLGRLLYAAATGELANFGELEWSDSCGVGIVVAAKGYPDSPLKGGRIELPADEKDAYVIHAGTATSDDGLYACGGRVLNVVGLGETIEKARQRAYIHLNKINYSDGFHRNDIASDEYLATCEKRMS